MKRTACLVMLVLFSLGIFLPAPAENRSPQDLIEEMIVYYGTYGEEAGDQIQADLAELEKADPDQAARWRDILALWQTKDLELNADVLPDNLPDTDELCMVALGFQLNPDGTMRDELIQRLQVVARSAEKYPNAWIVCTGGGTAAENPDATEAGKMAEWLREHGIREERIIVEDRSLTTAQNAIYTYELIREKCPQVSQIAILSSDYHIATGVLLFGAQAILTDANIRVTSNACWKAPSGSLSSMFQAGALIELSGDVETAFAIYYETYDIHELPPLNRTE